MAERDYSKFLRENGRLNTRLIPRPAWVEMVNRHRRTPEVVERVYDDLFWLWDLNQADKKAQADGRHVSRVELAAELEGTMDDDDWWKLTEAFEIHLVNDFANDPSRWSDILDSVYDLQEREGWTRRQ